MHLECFKLARRTKEPRDLLFIDILSKSEDVEPTLKMTPPDSGIELREFRDSWEPLMTIVELEQFNFPNDLVDGAGLTNIKVVGKPIGVIGSNFKARYTLCQDRKNQTNSFGISVVFLFGTLAEDFYPSISFRERI